jgi:hypothetical protein
MGNYNVRRKNLLQAWQIRVAELTFQGKPDEYIAKEIFNTGDDPKKIANARSRLRNLRRNEHFQEYYRSIITEWTVHNVGRALQKLSQQIDDPNGWLANKAANDVITQSKKAITGADENTVVLKIEGMPEIGSPTDEEETV